MPITLADIDRVIAAIDREQEYKPPIFFAHPDWPKEYVYAVLAEYPDAIVHVTDRIE